MVQRALTPCTSSSSLCLTQQRFKVEVDWTDHQNQSGKARPVRVAAQDSGFFWFFNDQNLELVIKVLDGCGVNGRYWVFAAGLTDGVGIRIESR